MADSFFIGLAESNHGPIDSIYVLIAYIRPTMVLYCLLYLNYGIFIHGQVIWVHSHPFLRFLTLNFLKILKLIR